MKQRTGWPGVAILCGAMLLFGLVLFFLSGCANHCRINQRVPEGETFESAERLTKEQCK